MRSDRGNLRPLIDEIDRLGEHSPRRTPPAGTPDRRADPGLFRAAMDGSDDVVIIVEASGSIADVSGAVGRRLGYGRDELAGGSLGVILDEEVRSAISRMFTVQTERMDLSATLHGKDGVAMPCDLRVNLVRVDGGTVAVMVARDAAARNLEEERLRASLHEKEVMLKEIHHRVKNNLQVISSLLHLQAQYLADPQDARLFLESQDRIRTMALVHEKLYQSSDLATIDFGAYIERLTTNLFRSYHGSGGNVRLYIDVKAIYLNAEAALPCGLIVNELVTNALKYAFRDGRDGLVTVAMRREGDCYVLEVSDDGMGMPPDFDIARADSLGLQLVNTLAGQIEGRVSVQRSNGTKFAVRFRQPPAAQQN